MIKPYTAVGLIPTVRGIRKRKDIKINLEHLSHLVKAAAWLSSLSLPVRLIAIPEGALQGFNDEVMDLDHVKFAREGAIDIPGDETEYLGKMVKIFGVRSQYCSFSCIRGIIQPSPLRSLAWREPRQRWEPVHG
jgi:hypothetical protein